MTNPILNALESTESAFRAIMSAEHDFLDANEPERERLHNVYLTARAAQIASWGKPANNRLSGVVTHWNAKAGYGYIKSGDERYYFRAANLKHADVSLSIGDTVTFALMPSAAINASQPRALHILVDGYTPPAPVKATAGKITKEEIGARLEAKREEMRERIHRQMGS